MQIDNLFDEIQKTSSNNTDLLKKIESLELEKSKLEQQIAKCADRKKELIKRIEEQNHEIDSMLNDVAYTPYEEPQESYQEQLQSIIRGLQNQLEEYKNNTDYSNDKIIEDIENRLELYQSITTFENKEKVEYDKLKSIVDELENQMKQCREAMQIDIAACQKDDQLQELVWKVDETERRIVQFEETLNEYNNVASTSCLAAETIELNNFLTKLQTEFEGLKKSIKEREDNVGSYEKRIKELENMKVKQEKECEEMIASLKKQYSEHM